MIYQRNYEYQSYSNQSNRQRHLKSTNDNRSYFSRHLNQRQDQFVNTQFFNTRYVENSAIKSDRQYSNQYSFNNFNQKSVKQFFAQDFASQFARAFYQYDKDKQNANAFQFKSAYSSYDRFSIFRFEQSSFDQRQKTYYVDENEHYQKYAMNLSNEYENQKNAYIVRKKDSNIILISNEVFIKEEFEKILENFFVDCSVFINSSHKCRRYEFSYFFNNKFHKHLKICRNMQETTMYEFHESSSKVILSDVKSIDSFNFFEINLRRWHYFIIKTTIAMIIFDLFCLNTDCKMSMIDKTYFCKLISNYKSKITTIDTSTKVRNIETFVVIFNESIKNKYEYIRSFKWKICYDKNIRDFSHSERVVNQNLDWNEYNRFWTNDY